MNGNNRQPNRPGGNGSPPLLKRTATSKRIWLIVGLLLLLPVLLFAAYRVVLKGQIHSRVQKIKESGFPVELTQLDALYVTPPQGSNAADLYLAAFGKIIKGDTNSPTLPVLGTLTLHSTNTLTPESLREGDSLIRSNQAAFAELEEATKLKECRYPVKVVDGWAATLPHLAKLKSMAQLLRLRTLISSETGDTADAVKSMELTLSLGNSLRREPCLISYMVRIATVSINGSALERALNHAAFSEEQLVTLQDVFARSEDTNALSFAFANERCFGVDTFKNPREFILTDGYAHSTDDASLSSALGCIALQSVGSFDRDQIFYLDTLSGWIDAAKLKHPERLDDFDQKFAVFMQNKTKRVPYIISAMLLPSLEKVALRDARLHAVARLSQTAVAIERFRLRHGHLPETLEKLTPDFLAHVPEDPFAEEFLRYQKSADGYQIYSVGPDRTDDGGKRDPKGFGFDREGYDLTFEVHYPNKSSSQ